MLETKSSLRAVCFVLTQVFQLSRSFILMLLVYFNLKQTDPNWSNFLYDDTKRCINLIDFGAARDYPKIFVDDYLRMVRCILSFSFLCIYFEVLDKCYVLLGTIYRFVGLILKKRSHVEMILLEMV